VPRPPCQTEAPFPGIPASTTAPNVKTWQASDSSPRWVPPACTGWGPSDDHGYRTMVAFTGRIELQAGHGTSELLHRIGAVSMLQNARY
jgi:hypothetical protein